MDFWIFWKIRKVILQTELCPWKFIIKALTPSVTVFRDRTFKEVIKVGQTVKNLPAMCETQVRSLGGEDPLEKAVATHSSILA